MHSLNVMLNHHVAEPRAPYGPLPPDGASPEETAGKPATYDALVESIVRLHHESAGRAAAAVNRWLSLRNWLIGAYIVEFEQHGEDRAAYGSRLLEAVARDLGTEGCEDLATLR